MEEILKQFPHEIILGKRSPMTNEEFNEVNAWCRTYAGFQYSFFTTSVRLSDEGGIDYHFFFADKKIAILFKTIWG